MRVLFVDLEREWRGGQSQALFTIQGLRDNGHEVELLAARGSPLAKRLARRGIPVREVARFGLRAWAASEMRRLIEQGRFDLVHLNEPHAVTSAWMAGVQGKLPLLFSRRIGFPLQRNWASRRRYRAIERFLPNCKAVAQSLMEAGIAAERISVVNEGVELPSPVTPEMRPSARKQWGVKEAEFLFGCTSVFVPEKGQRHLIEALPQVREQFPQARLLLAGDGRCRAELESLAKQLGQNEAAIFAGFVEDIDEVHKALDAYVFPSEFEGTGTALQAAMAWGLPCISTARGGLNEVVDNERTALVAEPEGKEFAGAMIRMLNDPGLRKKLGEAGRREIEKRFSAAQMVKNTIHVYEDVLTKWRAR
ncbi:MAG TPA: glycosyltransferase family 4 protein [Candidatus Acidoferrum sp.]|jgi:glycosyltransferase involved in cell wall biosynthesis|nr:glycosyltransferase family 4 protein [Candidatus Acidoferrum sp.]